LSLSPKGFFIINLVSLLVLLGYILRLGEKKPKEFLVFFDFTEGFGLAGKKLKGVLVFFGFIEELGLDGKKPKEVFLGFIGENKPNLCGFIFVFFTGAQKVVFFI